MHSSLKVLLILILGLQFSAFGGPVCGNHVSTMESMDCCKKGHQQQQQTTAATDSHAEDCCSTCDMGKGSSIQAQKQDMSFFDAPPAVLSFVSPQSDELRSTGWEQDQFHSYSPPRIFLINATFRI